MVKELATKEISACYGGDTVTPLGAVEDTCLFGGLLMVACMVAGALDTKPRAIFTFTFMSVVMVVGYMKDVGRTYTPDDSLENDIISRMNDA